MSVGKERYVFIDYLKAIAALLIVNSHFDSLYPIKALATGGAIGNAIFFAVSGSLLYPVASDFKSWIKKRLTRIYVPVWIVTIVMLLIGSAVIECMTDVFQTFIWPTKFWFAGGIIVFYLLYYAMKDVTSKKAFMILGVCALIVYFAYYIFALDTSKWVVEAVGLTNKDGIFKLIYYFAALMIGKYFAIYSSEFKRGGVRGCVISAVLAFVSIYGVKFLMNRIPILMHVQFLNQFSVLWLVISLFFISLRVEDSLKARSGKFDCTVTRYIADYTFEIYLVQFIAIHIAGEKLGFPTNAIAAVLMIVVFAWILKKVENLVYRFIKI